MFTLILELADCRAGRPRFEASSMRAKPSCCQFRLFGINGAHILESYKPQNAQDLISTGIVVELAVS